MGYYTTHKLEIISGNDYVTDYEKEIAEVSGYSRPFEDSHKWYDHEEHMREYSKRHPNTIFKVIGEGEDSSDLWHEYYKNGKMQKCIAKITYDEFNENKLA